MVAEERRLLQQLQEEAVGMPDTSCVHLLSLCPSVGHILRKESETQTNTQHSRSQPVAPASIDSSK